MAAYDTTSAPREGDFRLAGWLPGATGLVFFPDETRALEWLMDRSGQLIPGRTIFRLQFGAIDKQAVILPPGPYLKSEG